MLSANAHIHFNMDMLPKSNCLDETKFQNIQYNKKQAKQLEQEIEALMMREQQQMAPIFLQDRNKNDAGMDSRRSGADSRPAYSIVNMVVLAAGPSVNTNLPPLTISPCVIYALSNGLPFRVTDWT
jgi:hypothetical protein